MALITGTLVAGNSQAGSNGEWVWVIGGEETCARWLTDRVKGPDAASSDQIWLEGFLSGSNWAQAATYGRGDSGEFLWHYIDAYCRVHPSENISVAAAYLMLALSKSR
jgi:hypothetical protein